MKKNSMFSKRYQASYESKDRGGFTKVGAMDWKKVDGEVSFYQPQAGRNRINIIPFEVKSKNHPLVKRGEMEVGDMDYMMDVWVHRGVGATEASVVCLKNTYGKPCPICEQAALLRKQGKEEEANALKPSRRVFYNVEDLKDPGKVKVFETSHYLFEKELIDEARDDEEGGFVDFADPENGKEIKFRANESSFGKNKYFEYKSFSFEDREEPVGEELLENAISFDEVMRVPTYEEAQRILFGADEDEDDEVEEDDDEELPSRPSKRVEEEEDEEEEKPVKATKRVMESSDEDYDDDAEGPVPPPSKCACKHGHRFGKDCDNYDDCDDCDMWEKCFKSK